MILHTHEAGGYLGNGAIVFVATLLGNSCLIPLLRRCFLLSRDFALSIRAACILASFVAVGEHWQKTQPLAKSELLQTSPRAHTMQVTRNVNNTLYVHTLRYTVNHFPLYYNSSKISNTTTSATKLSVEI